MAPNLLSQLQKLVSPLEEGKVSSPLKILIVGVEVSPFANVGGFARVLGYLSRALKNMGHDVRIFMPKFGFLDEEKYKNEMVLEGLRIPDGGGGELICNVKKHVTPFGVTVYFLENKEYYEIRANVYGYRDDPVRWALLCRGALEFIRAQNWVPDIIHSNDWHTGITSNFLRVEYSKDTKLRNIAAVFTIHNLAFQGMYDHKNVSELDRDDGHSPIASLFSDRLGKQNFMRRGILYSDLINTVSDGYSREILTPDYGEGLDQLLLELRSKLTGIVNGLDYQEFNPATDKFIEANYDIDSLDLRYENKKKLQKEFGLPVDKTIPVIGVVGRLDPQKGHSMILEIMWHILKDFDTQLVVLGGGESDIASQYRSLKEAFPSKVGVHLMPDFTLPRLIFSGSDIMLFPSKYEPCGITQLEGMRYGTVPVARATGGLADTIQNYNPRTGEGYGFVFKNYDHWEFFAQLVRALEMYNQPNIWRTLVKRCMSQDFSWEGSARKYSQFYQRAQQVRLNQLVNEGVVTSRFGRGSGPLI